MFPVFHTKSPVNMWHTFLCQPSQSLGGKEEKTKNKVMAAVGDRTRAQEGRLQEDSMVESVVLEWNEEGILQMRGKGWLRA